jgi:hypothetical protein
MIMNIMDRGQSIDHPNTSTTQTVTVNSAPQTIHSAPLIPTACLFYYSAPQTGSASQLLISATEFSCHYWFRQLSPSDSSPNFHCHWWFNKFCFSDSHASAQPHRQYSPPSRLPLSQLISQLPLVLFLKFPSATQTVQSTLKTPTVAVDFAATIGSVSQIPISHTDSTVHPQDSHWSTLKTPTGPPSRLPLVHPQDSHCRCWFRSYHWFCFSDSHQPHQQYSPPSRLPLVPLLPLVLCTGCRNMGQWEAAQTSRSVRI